VNQPEKLMTRKEVMSHLFTEGSMPCSRTWRRRELEGLIPFIQLTQSTKLYYLSDVREAFNDLRVAPGRTRKASK